MPTTAMPTPGLASIVLATTLTATLLYITYLYALNRTSLAVHLKRKGYARCPHYQHKDILFGSDWHDGLAAASLGGIRQTWYREQFTAYGKTYETTIYGKKIFQTCDPVNVQAYLTASASDVGAGPSRAGLLSWLGPGAFTSDGEVWRHSREMLKPVFRRTAIKDMGRLERHLGRLLEEVEREGGVVDLQGHFIRMFLDFSMNLLIDEDVNTVHKDTSKIDFTSFFAACDASQMQVIRSAQPWLVRWWRGWTKTWNEPLDATQGFIAKYVDSAVLDFETKEGGPIQRTDAFLDDLIREAGTKDKPYLRDQLLNVFMPGRDTVAIEISYIFFYLARNPTIYEKVRAEVLAAGFEQEENISYDSLKTLPYVNAVVNETLRISGPPNGQTIRDIFHDIVLPRGGGIHGDQPILIPAGSAIYTQIRAMQIDPDIWGPDAETFRPERWLEFSDKSQSPGYEFIPFGGGRRTCPAKALALGEMAYIVVVFALRFREIQGVGVEGEFFEEGAILTKVRGGVNVTLVK